MILFVEVLIMAHLDKFTRTDSRGVLKEAYRELRKYKNNVDTSLSMNNYSMEGIKSSKEALKRVDARCAEAMNGRKMQKQTNVIVSCAYTLPEYFYDKPVDEQRKCFDAVYRFIQDRYGKENVIDGVVHNDETTPHMTVYTVPVTTSRKTGNITVSSASLCTQKEFNTFHKDLESYMEKEFGVKGLALNGRTKGNFTLEELKERTRVKEEQVLLKAKVEAEKEQLDKDKVVQAEKQAQEQTFKQERESLELQKSENEQIAKQNEQEAQKLAQTNKELSERLAESEEILEEAKGLKAYWNQMIAWAKKCTITVMGETKMFGDWLSKKANQKKAEEKQENLNVRRTVTVDKISKQKKDINALLAAHGLSDDASTEDTHAYGL